MLYLVERYLRCLMILSRWHLADLSLNNQVLDHSIIVSRSCLSWIRNTVTKCSSTV